MSSETHSDQTLEARIAALESRLDAQQVEYDKLARVVTDVVGREFDTIMERQQDDQQAVLRWVSMAIGLTSTLLKELVAQGVVEEEVVRDRFRSARERIIERAEGMGATPDIEALFSDV